MAKTWKPLEDGRYIAEEAPLWPTVIDIEGDGIDVSCLGFRLRPTYRLCILTDTEPTIPATKDVVDALDKLLCYHEAFGAFTPEVTLLRKVLTDIGEAQGDAPPMG